MSILSDMMSKIFGRQSAATPAAAGTATGSPPTAPAGTPTTAGAGAGKPMSRQEVEAMVQKIADDTGRQNYNWKQSIVDLMKLLDLDSSLAARKQLAQELGYTGQLNGSAEMNIWLHQQVMTKLAESGGVVPDSLKHA